jgi:Zn-finger nucleic acid-binding protein
VFESICEEADKQELARRHLREDPTPAVDARGNTASKPGYLACIECGDLMVPRNFGGTSGVIVDVCRGHGVWLDHRELERVLDFVRAGGLDRARERELRLLEDRAQRAREARTGGAELSFLGRDDIASFGDREDRSLLGGALRWIGDALERG